MKTAVLQDVGFRQGLPSAFGPTYEVFMMKKFSGLLAAVVCMLLPAACSPAGTDGSAPGSAVSGSSSVVTRPPSSPEVSSPETSSPPATQPSAGETPPVTVAPPPTLAPTSPPPTTTPPTTQAPKPTTPPTAATVNVTIPEGFTLPQIAARLEEKGVCSKDAFLEMAQTYDFSYYSLIGALPDNPHRCFTLEGYLFPNTYNFYKGMKPQDAIGVLLRGAQAGIGDKYAYPGMSTHELVILASIIEKEASGAADRKLISGVLHNRLEKGWKLQADPTINYVEQAIKPNITGDKDRYSAYYNTYRCAALPAGPICNPGASALDAAANPTRTAYMFFVSDKVTGEIYYAVTGEEHEANLIKAGYKVESAGASEAA